MLKDNLIMLRNIHGFSQEEIAGKIGISRQAYAKWESGATVPDIEKCKRLADIYGVTIDSLITTETIDGKESIPPAPKGRNIWGSVTINERGQLVIPKAAREKFGLAGGQRLIVLSADKEGIALVPAEIFEERMKKQWSGHLPNQRNNRPRLLTAGNCVGGEEPFMFRCHCDVWLEFHGEAVGKDAEQETSVVASVRERGELMERVSELVRGAMGNHSPNAY